MAFWGLVLEPKKKYTQTAVELPFHVSMAALDLQNCDSNEDASSVVLRSGETDFILCSLSKKKGILNVPLNLEVELGKEVNFHILGNSSVHLTGFIVEEEMGGFDSDDSLEDEDNEDIKSKGDLFRNTKKLLEESTSKRKTAGGVENKAKKAKIDGAEEDDDSDDDDFDLEDDDDDSDLGEEEEEDDSEDDDDEEDDEEVETQVKAPVKQKPGDQKPQEKKKQNNAQNAQQGNKDKKANNQKQIKGQNTPQQNKAANGSEPQSNGLPPKKIVEGGVQVEELRVGNGPVAKRGKMVSVYYVGRLKQNNKKFDASQSGPGFKFRLGGGEVIKGWDVGLMGMKVGSKRRLTIPAKMAYGPRGSPPVIPPNSTLVFDAELKNVQ